MIIKFIWANIYSISIISLISLNVKKIYQKLMAIEIGYRKLSLKNVSGISIDKKLIEKRSQKR